MFGLDPFLSTILVSSGIFIVSFLIGKEHGKRSSTDEIIGHTILYLCNEGFIRYKRDRDGEIEIMKLENGRRSRGSSKSRT
jgi:hypothetical protein